MKKIFVTFMILIFIFVTSNVPAGNVSDQNNTTQVVATDKNKYIAAGLAIIMCHQFYLGNIKTGVVYWASLLLFGFGYAVSILDLMTLLFMDDDSFNRFMQPDNPDTIPVAFFLFEEKPKD